MSPLQVSQRYARQHPCLGTQTKGDPRKGRARDHVIVYRASSPGPFHRPPASPGTMGDPQGEVP